VVLVQSPEDEKTVLDNQFNLIGPLKSDSSFLNNKGRILSICLYSCDLSMQIAERGHTFLNL